MGICSGKTFWQDLKHWTRTLCKSPSFTAVVVLTLALGIGATTAIFTLMDAVMLKSLPVANPGQLYRLGDNNNCCVMTGTQDGGSFVLYSYPLYEHLRDHTAEFTRLAAFASYLSDLSVRRQDHSAAEPYKGEFVSRELLSRCSGIGAIAGRTLTPKDDTASASPVAVMSYHTWQTRYRLRPFGDWRGLHHQHRALHGGRGSTAQILWRYASQRPSRFLAAVSCQPGSLVVQLRTRVALSDRTAQIGRLAGRGAIFISRSSSRRGCGNRAGIAPRPNSVATRS